MIRLTERYYDVHAHGYCSKPLFLKAECIAGVKSSDDMYENYTIVSTTFGASYTVLESAETVASMCTKEKT
jgi:hypothetical protein